ncbi:hypothetical protein M422DRAFT_272860 [Sphaerobolus stellatus SS14]|uniref:F-box domain-containing protein n=1 Tax=Sphaerobolus stellatus (strain SS14) TaxID=990650 RepID=A0A0C9TAI9_SPHS4|nr:hypothetical protein M422DRAFT_272860 [Sphaerobolus stellatus SS14]
MDNEPPHFHDSFAALKLSHVSSNWRSIARSDSTLCREIYPTPNTMLAGFCAELAVVDLTVSLELISEGGQVRGTDSVIEAACRFIRQNAKRISKLFVIGDHPLMETFLTTPFPELRKTILEFDANVTV